ncbi:MAG TPA: hypothetical protein VIG05_02670 [Candidatus Nitrosotenuis sp.]
MSHSKWEIRNLTGILICTIPAKNATRILIIWTVVFLPSVIPASTVS